MNYDLSVVILNYNTKKLLRDLLDSVFLSELGNYKMEIIVVDNASNDGSVQMVEKCFPQVKLIINQENLGFSRGNNKGIKESKGKYILLLNSDTVLQKETLFKMIKFMDKNEQYAAATCRVELPNGDLDPACHRGFPTPWNAFTYFLGLERIFPRSKLFGQYHQGWKDLEKPHQVDAISGAFFMVRKKVLGKTGTFDERFFMYAEDIDLCYRLKKLRFKIAFYPETKIVHFKKKSGRSKEKSKLITQKDKKAKEKARESFYQTMKLFYNKHYKNKYPWILRQLVLIGIWVVSKLKE